MRTSVLKVAAYSLGLLTGFMIGVAFEVSNSIQAKIRHQMTSKSLKDRVCTCRDCAEQRANDMYEEIYGSG